MKKSLPHPGLGLLLVTAYTVAIHAESAKTLLEALGQDGTTTVKAAINNGADVNSRDDYGNTLLVQAAVYAKPSDLDFLLAHGADANAANKNGHTTLMRAVPDLAKIALLVEHGAAIKVATVDGTTPLMMAAESPQTVVH